MPAAIDFGAGRMVGEGHPCFIIAEVGYSHQGDIEIAKEYIRKAKVAGVDVIKFQKQHTGPVGGRFTKAALAAPYTSANAFGPTYGEHRNFLEFSEEQFIGLKQYAKEVGIAFSSSGQDYVSFDFLCKIDCPFIKIGSGDTGNIALIEHVAKKGKPTILSSGMGDFATVKAGVEAFLKHNKQLVLLQCTSSYPLPNEEVHLRVMDRFKEEFPDVIVGYSGHETGISISLAAIARGAKCIERHVTLDKTWKGSDHSASLDFDEFKALVDQARIVEKAIGSRVKEIQPSEAACMGKLGKVPIFGKRKSCGEAIVAGDIEVKVAKREPNALALVDVASLVGKKVTRDVAEEEPVTTTSFE